jgi:hypothetical protein
MERNTIEKILNFLKENEGYEFPEKWEWMRNLETHPDDVQYNVENDLDLRGSHIIKLPNDLHVGGILNAAYSEGLTEFPDKLHVERDLWLNSTNITNLPKYLYVGGDLYIWTTPIAKNYTKDEIYDAIKLGGGRIVGRIFI